MRDLHIVGVSDDGTQLLLATSPEATKPTHAVALNGRLRAAARGELSADARVESALSPKEIQARLRSGDTIEAIAKAAGVPMMRIQRYAGPVLSERELILDAARAAVPRRDRGGAAIGEPLGVTVDARLAATTALKSESVQWTAKRRDDGAWVIGLAFSARGGARQAEWLWVPANHELRPMSAAAARFTAPVAPTVAKRATKTTGLKAAKKTAVRKQPTAAGKRAVAKPAKTVKPVKAVKITPVKAVRPVKRAPGTPRKAPREAPVMAPTIRNGRAEVPSWSDVLFGAGNPVQPGEAKAARRRRA